jgi:hypothetical protein
VQSLLIKGSAPSEPERKLERAHAPAAHVAVVSHVSEILRLVSGIVNHYLATEPAALHVPNNVTILLKHASKVFADRLKYQWRAT